MPQFLIRAQAAQSFYATLVRSERQRPTSNAQLPRCAAVGRSDRQLGIGSWELGVDPLERTSQPERFRLYPHETDHVADVHVERQAELLGAATEIVAVHGPREG